MATEIKITTGMSDELKVVWKFTLSLSSDPQLLDIPVNYNLIHAELDGWKIHLWYEIRRVNGVTEPHVYEIFGTGKSVPFCAQHLRSFRKDAVRPGESPSYWHLYEYPRGTRIVEVL